MLPGVPGRVAVVPVPVESLAGVQVSAAGAVQVAAYLRDIVARAESDRGALTIEQHNEALDRLEAVAQGANVQPEGGALRVALRVAIPGQSSDFVRYQTVHGLAETVAALADVAATVADVGRAEAWTDSGVCLARVAVSPEASGWQVPE